jgi:general secretion pathway protein D
MATVKAMALWRWVPRMLLVAAAVTLVGCAAARQAYYNGHELISQGKYEEGLAQLEEAVRRDPRNVQYRITLAGQRTAVVFQQLQAAEQAMREGRLSDAERAYRRIQGIEPDNAMARQGLDAIVSERRHRERIATAEASFKADPLANANDALAIIRDVLAENPRQKEALNLRGRIEDALAKQQAPVARLAATYRKPITLEFRDAPIKSVFDAIAKISGLNFFFDKDVRPDLKATLLAKDTSIEDAIRILLVTNQLEQRVLGDNAVLIYPNTPQKLKDYQTLMLRTFYLANADVKAVSNTLKTMLKTQDLVIDERLGLIIMRDTPEAIRLAERLIGLQDLADPEVMLEVEILEIKRSRLLEAGIRLPDQASLVPISPEGSALTLEQLLHITQDTTQALVGGATINLRKEDQDGNILANPRIRVRNKSSAQVLIGDRVPVITTTSTSTGFVSESVTYVDVGLKLEVEPDIYLDEEVAIEIKLEVSNLVREVVSKTGTLAYQIGTRSANTVLRLKDGETQILAGLINDEDRTTANKWPVLGDLPMLGRLFGSRKDDRQRSEIVLSITPRLVRSLRRPDLVSAEFESGTQTSVGARSLTLGAADAAEADPKAAAEKPAAPAVAPIAAPAPENAPAPTPLVTPVTTPSTSEAPRPAAETANAPVPEAKSTVTGTVDFQWSAPREVRVGEQFGAILKIASDGPVRALPLMVAYDPKVLQLVSAEEGEFLRQGGARTRFNHRNDPAQGRVFLAAIRENINGNDNGVNGVGSVVQLAFKAIGSGKSNLRLISATPEPAHDVSRAIPLEHAITIAP